MTLPAEPSATPVDESGAVLTSKDRGVSQGKMVFRRFLAHKPAVFSFILLVVVIGFAASASGVLGIPGWWIWSHDVLAPIVNGGKPTFTWAPFSFGEHPLGQNTVGKDYFAMTMRGIVTSALIMFVIGFIAAIIGVVIGAISGYYRGWVDAVLMRLTDVVIVIPVIVIGAVVGVAVGGLGPALLAIFLGFVAWTGVARWCGPSSCRCASGSLSKRLGWPEPVTCASFSSTSCQMPWAW